MPDTVSGRDLGTVLFALATLGEREKTGWCVQGLLARLVTRDRNQVELGTFAVSPSNLNRLALRNKIMSPEHVGKA